MRKLVSLAIAVTVLACPGAASGARTISLGPSGFDPVVAIVSPGTHVTWRNDTSAAASIVVRDRRGEIATRSPDLPPGGTFGHRFRSVGQFRVTNSANDSFEGTVIVAARGRRASRPSGRAEYRYKGTLLLSVNESWKYYDDKEMSTNGPCNGMIGDGSRIVRLRLPMRDVRYTRLGRIEILRAENLRGRWSVHREQQDARVSDPNRGPDTTCRDGTTDAAPIYDADCSRSLAGKPVRITFGWLSQGRFLFTDDAPEPQAERCGPDHQSGLAIAAPYLQRGLGGLPLNLLAGNPPYGTGATSPATLAEARAIRRGRGVVIRRTIFLTFTADCCNQWTPSGTPGTYARVGAVFTIFARLEIHLRRR
jgi:plastocyanin